MINALEELMYRRIVLAALMAFALSTAALAQSVTGAWDLAVQGPDGPVNATATLQQDGEKVTGEIESQAGKTTLTGTMKGKTLSMAFTMQGPQGSMDIKVTGEVDGASMKGVIDFGMGMAEFTAKKK